MRSLFLCCCNCSETNPAKGRGKKERGRAERRKRKVIPDTWTLCTGVPSFNEYVYGATGVTFDGKE